VSGLSKIFDEIGQVGPLGRVHVNVVAVANVLLVALKQAETISIILGNHKKLELL
jgi:hypothetical protein